MTDEIYNKLKEITPILRFPIVDEKINLPAKIDFVLTLDVHGVLVRLKKFKEEDFVYIDGFIHLENPIPEPAMLALHSMIDNNLRIGINVDNSGEGEMIHNILIHDRIYKDDISVGEMDKRIFIIYNCMSKVSGVILGISNTIAHGKKDGTSKPSSDEALKSYG